MKRRFVLENVEICAALQQYIMRREGFRRGIADIEIELDSTEGLTKATATINIEVLEMGEYRDNFRITSAGVQTS